jgi:hypothetical protein
MPQTIKPEDVIDVLLDARESSRDLCWCSRGWTMRVAGRVMLSTTAREQAGQPHSKHCLKAQALMAQALEAL